MGINFDLTDLQASRAVVELGNFRKAAEAVSISQPVLGRWIDRFESTLDAPLFERTTRSVTPTIIGHVFARNAEQLFDDLDVALLDIRDVSSSHLGQVIIACVPSVAHYLLPNLIANYHRCFPRIRVKLLNASTSKVLRAVISGEADLGPSFTGNREPEIEFKTLLQERFATTCRHDRSSARKKHMTWRGLYAYGYVLVDKTSGNRLLLDQALSAVVSRAPSARKTRHVMTMLRLTEAGLGVAVVPSMTMPGHDYPILTSVPPVKPVVKRRAGIVKRRGRALTLTVEEFRQMIIDAKRSSITTGDAWPAPLDLPYRCTTPLARHGVEPG